VLKGRLDHKEIIVGTETDDEEDFLWTALTPGRRRECYRQGYELMHVAPKSGYGGSKVVWGALGCGSVESSMQAGEERVAALCDTQRISSSQKRRARKGKN
jgi:hypothetical protein